MAKECICKKLKSILWVCSKNIIHNMSNNDAWFNKLEKVIEYMTKNEGNRPPKTEKEIGSWLNEQLKFYRTVVFKGEKCGAGMWVNEQRAKVWAEFMNKFEDSLLSKEELWDKKLHMLDQYIAEHKSKPSENGTDEEVALLRWSYDQVKRVKPGTERYEKWQQLCQKYPEHFQSYDDSWNTTFDEIVAFVQKHKSKPSQDGADDDEIRLSRWMTRQNMSLSQGEMADDRVQKWEWFCMEFDSLHSISAARRMELGSIAAVESQAIASPREQSDSRAVESLMPAVKESLPPGVEALLNKHKKCSGKDRHGDPCRNYTTNGELYCRRAHSYLAEYTAEQIEKFRLCRGCLKWMDIPASKNQCSICDERGKKIREEAKTKVVLCKSEGCTFQKSDKNDYCGKHQICVFEDNCRDEGVRPCRRYLHGCRTKLMSDYGFACCPECLEKERKQENARRHNVVPDNVVNETKQCTVCLHWKPLSDYQNKNNSNITLQCISCRDYNAVANSKRDMEHTREIQRIASKKPERVAVKKAWEDNNYDKVALKTLTYRDKQTATNQEEYLKRNAETMAKWRENNPEKVREINNRNLLNTKKHMYNYTHKCEINGVIFNLTEDQFHNLIYMPCYYCSAIESKGFNGIDRMDSTRGYELDNCVSCCDECNTMKGALDNVTFIKRAEHILTHQGIINGKLHIGSFANHKNSNYNNYKKGAIERNYEFKLSEQEFNNIINQNCYICGKKNNTQHMNGIDRYDNTVGYTIDNCRPCCGQCNFMKKDLNYDYLLQKLLIIHNNCKNKQFIPISNPIINSLNRSICKPSKQERQINAKERKQRNREAKRLATGNTEYLRNRAQQMAKYRKQKKEAVNNFDNIDEHYSTDDEEL